ncbi:MAG: dTDP-4-dehydrorhamnose 3,5-epimerase [Vicinamibacteria bacterium]|nr:dTDP-4-dehydrorhamnose 3,5-epimerase [Vicinamibacteria bacterium]
MRVTQTELPGVLIIEPTVFQDARGFFLETFSAVRYEGAGVDGPFVQDNHSRSLKGSVRGLHLQATKPQGKLMRAVSGSILDVAVDVRVGSPTFGRWTSVLLSGDNFKQLYVPPGFAHGFAALSDLVDVEYKCTDYYDPKDELTVLWNDPAIGIQWLTTEPALSARDRAARPLCELMDRLPRFIP